MQLSMLAVIMAAVTTTPYGNYEGSYERAQGPVICGSLLMFCLVSVLCLFWLR